MSYHFFWGGPLSNWYKSEFSTKICFCGRTGRLFSSGLTTYNCVEQYMMAQKALLSNDFDTLYKIINTDDPKTQKQLGRQVINFNPKLWDLIKFDVVYYACMEKFVWNHNLRDDLFDTGDLILVEASPHDRIWGIGYDEKNALPNIQNWGENLLGKVLMKVRSVLRASNKLEDVSL